MSDPKFPDPDSLPVHHVILAALGVGPMKAELKIGNEYHIVPAKERPLRWQEQGLQYSASGYGNRIPTRYMVLFQGRWHRVYVCQYSNIGTAYIGKPSNWIAIVNDIDREDGRP